MMTKKQLIAIHTEYLLNKEKNNLDRKIRNFYIIGVKSQIYLVAIALIYFSLYILLNSL